MSTIVLISNKTTTGPSASQIVQTLRNTSSDKSFQGTGKTTAGTGTATITVEVSNDGMNWIVMGTVTLPLTTAMATDGFAVSSVWTYIRGNVTAISGTGAAVSLYMGLV